MQYVYFECPRCFVYTSQRIINNEFSICTNCENLISTKEIIQPRRVLIKVVTPSDHPDVVDHKAPLHQQ